MRAPISLIAIAAISFLVGCQLREPAVSRLSVPSLEQCATSGGSIVNAGLVGAPACRITTADAGKLCNDSSECEGRCLVDDWEGDKPPRIGADSKGKCEASNLTFGCFAEIRGGKIGTAFLCVD